MSRLVEQKIEEFYGRAVEQTRQAGMCAYVLSEDGRVLRVWPDGQQETVGFGLTFRPSGRRAPAGEADIHLTRLPLPAGALSVMACLWRAKDMPQIIPP